MTQVGEAEKDLGDAGGLPLTIRLEWPFHRSTSGADFWVLHGDIRLEGSEGLHAPVAVNFRHTVREVMPSLEPKDAEAPVINALRKEVDRRQIEFVKSGKLLPVPFSSRHYDFKREKWVFGKASGRGDGGVFGAEGLLGDEVGYRGARCFRAADGGDGSETQDSSRSLGMTKAWSSGFGLGILRRRSIWRIVLRACWKLPERLAGNGLLRIEGEWAAGYCWVDGAGGEV